MEYDEMKKYEWEFAFFRPCYSRYFFYVTSNQDNSK
jgi:hypothetical protein